MPPKSTTWPLRPHTAGKHIVLRAYLDAWLPKLSRWNSRVVLIDGFAGPGEYSTGEEGSPLIAIRALAEHNASIGEVRYVFMESDEARAEHLRELLESERRFAIPENANLSLSATKFDETATEILDDLDSRDQQLAPAFVMLDPFGVSDTPMAIVERLLKHPKCEIYISVMYEPINRFLSRPEFESHLDSLFGSREWRDAVPLAGEARKTFLYELYQRQLKAAGAQHVLRFELLNENRHVYTIFFATQSEVGCDTMKKAIWKADPGGTFTFRGSRTASLMFEAEVDTSPLAKQLIEQFGSEEWVTIEQVQGYVASDSTDFHTDHLKRKTLAPLEKQGVLQVDEGTRKRKGTYPAGTKLRFGVAGP